ncbi:MAG: RNA polymerase sigma factor [Woeseia sp.]|nr:RNA polymerase sigma factor [Woeseia sp.]NNL55072.1 RNA polymerase sigma factor [Woeseia sp.]
MTTIADNAAAIPQVELWTVEARSLLPSSKTLTYPHSMSVPVDDSALMLRYADGDVAAFDILYKRHNDGLFRYLLRLSNNHDTAADVFQEVWSKVIKSRHKYRPSAKFNTYLYRIAHNAFIDHIRRNKRYGDGPADDPDLRASSDAGPEMHAEQALARALFLGALRQLPDEQRDAFLLYEEGGLSIEQVAAVVNVPKETAKSRVRYAVNKLRKAMNEDRPDERVRDRED